MNKDILKEEITIEFDLIDKVIDEILSLKRNLKNEDPSTLEKTAAAAFLSQFYSGIENILKRICKFYEIPLPSGNNWHYELIKKFQITESPLPILFDKELANLIASYRKFRHVFFHGYGFQLEWDRMQEGIDKVEIVLEAFKRNVIRFLNTL